MDFATVETCNLRAVPCIGRRHAVKRADHDEVIERVEVGAVIQSIEELRVERPYALLVAVQLPLVHGALEAHDLRVVRDAIFVATVVDERETCEHLVHVTITDGELVTPPGSVRAAVGFYQLARAVGRRRERVVTVAQ